MEKNKPSRSQSEVDLKEDFISELITKVCKRDFKVLHVKSNSDSHSKSVKIYMSL